MTKEFKLNPPLMPNFITIQMPPGRREDGFKPEGNTIPVSSLTREEAEQYAELMKQTFMEHWEKKSNQNTTTK